MATPTYNLPVFADNDPVDLVGIYNKAMGELDTLIAQLNTAVQSATTAAGAAQSAASAAQEAAQDAVTTANGVASTAQEALDKANEAAASVSGITKNDSDTVLTVDQIKTAKVTTGGFIYKA